MENRNRVIAWSLLVFFVLILIACETETRPSRFQEDKATNLDTTKQIISPLFLFREFYEGMSERSFGVVAEQLYSEDKLSQRTGNSYYINEFHLENGRNIYGGVVPQFSEGKLIKIDIEIIGQGDNLPMQNDRINFDFDNEVTETINPFEVKFLLEYVDQEVVSGIESLYQSKYGQLIYSQLPIEKKKVTSFQTKGVMIFEYLQPYVCKWETEEKTIQFIKDYRIKVDSVSAPPFAETRGIRISYYAGAFKRYAELESLKNTQRQKEQNQVEEEKVKETKEVI